MDAEWIRNKLNQKIYPISHAQVIVRGRSTVDKDLTSLESRTTNIEEIIQQRLITEGNIPVILGRAEVEGEVNITTEGWERDGDLYHLDITNASISANSIAIVSVSPDSYDVAESCLLKAYCRTYDGILRLYAGAPPPAEIVASIALVGDNLSSGDGVNLNKGSGKLSIDRNVVVTEDDLVNETETLDDIRDRLNG